MTIEEILSDPAANWSREPPAKAEAVAALVTTSGLDLPDEYLTLIKFSNGGEGDLNAKGERGLTPYQFHIWPCDEVLQLNESYKIPEFFPEFFVFGSNLGLEMFAFRITEPHPWKVYMVPFIGSEKDAALLTENFTEFIKAMGHSCDEDEDE